MSFILHREWLWNRYNCSVARKFFSKNTEAFPNHGNTDFPRQNTEGLHFEEGRGGWYYAVKCSHYKILHCNVLTSTEMLPCYHCLYWGNPWRCSSRSRSVPSCQCWWDHRCFYVAPVWSSLLVQSYPQSGTYSIWNINIQARCSSRAGREQRDQCEDCYSDRNKFDLIC